MRWLGSFRPAWQRIICYGSDGASLRLSGNHGPSPGPLCAVTGDSRPTARHAQGTVKEILDSWHVGGGETLSFAAWRTMEEGFRLHLKGWTDFRPYSSGKDSENEGPAAVDPRYVSSLRPSWRLCCIKSAEWD
jgi:hypothetical protein